MNVSINEIAYRIKDVVLQKASDDIDISIEEIIHDIHNLRAKLLSQQFVKNPWEVDSSAIQTISNLKMALADSSTETSLPSEKYLMKSTSAIPELIRMKNGLDAITSIGSPDLIKKFINHVSHERAAFSGSGHFNKEDVYAFKYNKYLYLTGKGDFHKLIKYVNLDVIAENPFEVYLLNVSLSNQAAVTSFYDQPYPVSRAMLTAIEDIIVKEKLVLTLQAPVDRINDSSAELQENIK